MAAFLGAIWAVWEISSGSVEMTTTSINDNVNSHLSKTDAAVKEVKESVKEVKVNLAEVKGDLDEVKGDVAEMKDDIEGLAKIRAGPRGLDRDRDLISGIF